MTFAENIRFLLFKRPKDYTENYSCDPEVLVPDDFKTRWNCFIGNHAGHEFFGGRVPITWKQGNSVDKDGRVTGKVFDVVRGDLYATYCQKCGDYVGSRYDNRSLEKSDGTIIYENGGDDNVRE